MEVFLSFILIFIYSLYIYIIYKDNWEKYIYFKTVCYLSLYLNWELQLNGLFSYFTEKKIHCLSIARTIKYLTVTKYVYI